MEATMRRVLLVLGIALLYVTRGIQAVVRVLLAIASWMIGPLDEGAA